MGYGLEAALAGIGGAAKGMAEGFSWQKGRDDDRERREYEAEQERRRQDVMQHLARMREAGETARAKETAGDKLIDQMPDSDAKRRAMAARAKRVGLDLDPEAFRQPSTEPLPSRALPSLGSTETPPGVAGHTPVSFGPSPGVAPKYSIDPQLQTVRSKAVDTENATQARRRGVLEDYEKRKQIDRRYDKPGTAPAGPKDDPSLPRGVKAYIGTLRQKYGTLDGAVGEFTDALDDLYEAHPNLDAARARRSLDTLYKPTAPPLSEAEQIRQMLLKPAVPPAAATTSDGRAPAPAAAVPAPTQRQTAPEGFSPSVGRTPIIEVRPAAPAPPPALPAPAPGAAPVPSSESKLDQRRRARFYELRRELRDLQARGDSGPEFDEIVMEMRGLRAMGPPAAEPRRTVVRPAPTSRGNVNRPPGAVVRRQ